MLRLETLALGQHRPGFLLLAALARDLIELSGLKVGRDIDIIFTGLRPGEKLFEELFVPGEDYVRTAHEKIFVARNSVANAACCSGLDAAVDRLIAAAECGDRPAIIRAVQELVPKYRPADLTG